VLRLPFLRIETEPSVLIQMKNTETLSKSKALRNARNMTDMLKGSQVLQKTYTYIENVTKESRKALMEDFSQTRESGSIWHLIFSARQS